MNSKVFALLVSSLLKKILPLTVAFAPLLLRAAPAPFALTGAYAPKPPKSAKVTPPALDIFSAAITPLWMVENPQAGHEQDVFTISGGELKINADVCDPARTTVRVLLPGDGSGNGAVWAKGLNNYVSFQARATQPARMTFHLLQRGKTAGTFQAGFTVGGKWRRVTLPLADFKLKTFSAIAGVGVRVAEAPGGAQVFIKDISIGGAEFDDNAWLSQRATINLSGGWLFATDSGDVGVKEQWFAEKFDDANWRVLQSGQSWQQQGVDYSGWGWYRQKFIVPAELAGQPLRVMLPPIQSDDEVWLNGARIGGFSSEYKYKNWWSRVYSVPPELVKVGENTLTVRVWGGNITFIGNNSGLVKGTLAVEFDPYLPRMRAPGGQETPFGLFDLSDARRGKPFEIIFSFPPEVARDAGAKLEYRLADYARGQVAAGTAPLTVSDGVARAVVAVDARTAQELYFRGRFVATLTVTDGAGAPVYAGTREFDQLNFTARDQTPLPPLPETFEETPLGKLKLVDEIDCAKDIADDEHPYLQSGYDHAVDYVTPGCGGANVRVTEILGKQARTSDYGWFAYRLGRGKLKPRATYLIRIEYPEDQPRFVPIELQSGQNYMDVGYKNGVAPDDPYDNWPLSKRWEWYDVIIPLDDQSVGTGGTGSASAEQGLWLYFMNKLKPGQYYAMWSAGPAVARIKLYEIDAERDAPAINYPPNGPRRVLAFDWERGADCNPEDFARYAKLMGYNAMSPIMLKWTFANYSDPLDGYSTVVIDPRDYWAHEPLKPEPGHVAVSPWPSLQSQHQRFLAATKKFGLQYIPRFEYGGSAELPVEARAVSADGQPAKPNRFAKWSANLLNPATWDDLQKFMDHLVKPYVKDHPQLTGVHWRIRCDRMQISYGEEDLKKFAAETGTTFPPGGLAQWQTWAATEGRAAYDTWWHRQRADFHIKLSQLLKSYRADLTLYYFNWDPDKFGIIEPDITAWAFVANVVKPAPNGGRAAYEKERAARKAFTARDYIAVMRNGNFGAAFKNINRADYGIRPELYQNTPGIQIFAPANYLCYADKPEYLNYFQTADGLAVSNVVSYDEIGARTINPKYEGNMITPGGAPFSMALELLAYFHGDARTLNWTVYTYGRGFAAAHRRFAQAYLALPATNGAVIEQGDPDVKARAYTVDGGETRVGIAYKGYAAKTLTVKLPGLSGTVVDLVTNQPVPAKSVNGGLEFTISVAPMELNAYQIK
ncbi:MAG: hypothetical protein LBK60_10555 [Verrucomicrobiales bacterium]|jgi:hypothetical protein|nr:hypothetical protein [Verrucomicrobiales bacterium]